MSDDRALSTHLEPAKRELAALVETRLITPEQQRSLAVATTNLSRMKTTSTPAAGRHFAKIDAITSVKGASPIAQARECLAGLANSWEGLSEDFHKYRKLHMEAKLLRARIVKARKALDAIVDDDDRAIAEAELDLEEARAAELEAQVAKGATALQDRISAATARSDQYALICKQAGKEEFTEADFRAEEIDYFLRTAWWHAAQVYEVVDTRDEWSRDYDAMGERIQELDPNLPRGKMREARGLQRRNAMKHSQIRFKQELLLYFQGLGVQEHEIEAQIRRLLSMREGFDLVPRNNGRDFTNHFEGWLNNCVAEFRSRASAAITQHGFERLKRIATMLDPDEDDGGTHGDVKRMGRGSGIR